MPGPNGAGNATETALAGDALRRLVAQEAAAGRRVATSGFPDAGATAETVADGLIALAELDLRYPGALQRLAPQGAWDDPWVTGAARIAREEGSPITVLERVRVAWLARLEGLDRDTPDARAGERQVRRLDDARRRIAFELLRMAWKQDARGWPDAPLTKEAALRRVEAELGPSEGWIKAFRQYSYDATIRRLVVIPTWQCELRCSYCYIPKQDGRVMTPTIMERAIEFLMASTLDEVVLQYFGGEALLEAELVFGAFEYADRRARELGKKVEHVLSSNGWSLTPERLARLAKHHVKLELSLDGDRRTQERFRSARFRAESSYTHSIAANAEAILASGIEQYVIMVVHPTNVAAMPDNFFHIADLGFRHIQINPMLGRVWTEAEMATLAEGLHRIGRECERRQKAGERIEFINLRHKPMPMRLNGEVTIDHDGTIYAGNAFLHETEHKHRFVVGHLDQGTGIDRYWMDLVENDFLLEYSYRSRVTDNNLKVGRIMTSFCRWMVEHDIAVGDASFRDAWTAAVPQEEVRPRGGRGTSPSTGR